MVLGELSVIGVEQKIVSVWPVSLRDCDDIG